MYPARLLYPDGRVFTFSSFSRASLSSPELQVGLDYSAPVESLVEANIGRYAGDGDHEILVCTHGARDCRCSDRGGPLVDALRAEISRRGVEGRVRVNEIAHVGGHKFDFLSVSCLILIRCDRRYAANAILLPGLDLLSNLDSSHAPAVLSHLLAGRPKRSGMWEHWRGRYGLTEAQQQTVWSKVDASVQETVDIPRVDPKQDREMVRLRFRTFEGDLLDIEAQMGQSLLEVARANDLPSLEGVCGGNLGESFLSLYDDGEPRR